MIDITYEDKKISEQPTQRIEDIWGMFKTVSTAPTNVPRNMYEQIVHYKNGATYRLYIYDVDNNAWRYATLT